jgi:pimeloyl-ACP methyl ester carboxylesterase
MVIAIPGVEVSADRLLDFWSYVRDQINALIVVPDFLLEPGKGYEYSLEEHARYRQLLSDVRRRFAVDSDRVFLTGHEVGAFAAFDLAISHPDELAGLISFGGLPRFYSQYYWRNVGHLPIYAVDGALNGDNPILMNEWSQRAFRRGEPIISVIYLGRGNGGFEAELPTIVDWMNRQRRQPYPDVIESASARHSDRRFYWVEMDAFMPNATIPPQLFDKKKGVKPGRIDARIEQGATLRMDTVSLESIHIHLSPDLVAFDDPNLTVKVNRKVVHAGPIRPDLTTLVRVLRDTGDNRRLVFKTLTTPTR